MDHKTNLKTMLFAQAKGEPQSLHVLHGQEWADHGEPIMGIDEVFLRMERLSLGPDGISVGIAFQTHGSMCCKHKTMDQSVPGTTLGPLRKLI